jgi:hypothetical protein
VASTQASASNAIFTQCKQIAHSNRIFPPRKSNTNNNAPTCTYCGIRNHTEQECHKRIAEEYNAKRARKAQNQNGGGGKGKGRGGRRGGKGGKGNANLADTNSNAGDAPAYGAIFGGLAFCLKAALNSKIRRVKGVWIKDNGATHHMHHDKSLFATYNPLKHRLYVGGIGSGLKAVGIGDVEIKDPNGKSITLEGVLHAPKLKCGLMSLNTLALVGLDSTIAKNGCTVSDGDFRIHSPIKNGLCMWTQDGDSESGHDWGVNALFVGIAPKKVSLTDLHERLAHVN